MKMTTKQTLKAIEEAEKVVMYVNVLESYIKVDKEQAIDIIKDLSVLLLDDEEYFDVSGTKAVYVEENKD